MRHRRGMALGVLVLCVACGQESSGSEDRVLRETVQEGLERQFNVFRVPVGEFEVKGRYDRSGNNLKAKSFRPELVATWRQLEALGLYTLTEREQSAFDVMARAGAKTLTLELTEKGSSGRDPKGPSADYADFPLGECEVLEIIENEPHQIPGATEDYRVVRGRHRTTLTPLGLAASRLLEVHETEGVETQQDLKFKALLVFDPVTQLYVFKVADWGHLDSAEWKTHRVASFGR